VGFTTGNDVLFKNFNKFTNFFSEPGTVHITQRTVLPSPRCELAARIDFSWAIVPFKERTEGALAEGLRQIRSLSDDARAEPAPLQSSMVMRPAAVSRIEEGFDRILVARGVAARLAAVACALVGLDVGTG
jgi:hypothetical protein